MTEQEKIMGVINLLESVGWVFKGNKNFEKFYFTKDDKPREFTKQEILSWYTID